MVPIWSTKPTQLIGHRHIMAPKYSETINLMNIVNQAIEEQEERMLQETILASLNDANQENNNAI